MLKVDLKIEGIPTILWGEPSDKIFISVHGNMSSKDDDLIEIFAEEAIDKGYQVLSFDLPEHGDKYRNDLHQYCFCGLKTGRGCAIWV